MKEALFAVPLFREFALLPTVVARLPDESTLLRFRRLLEAPGLAAKTLTTANDALSAKGVLLKSSGVVDATLIAAPGSTKNRSGSRDPEVRQTKKGNDWHCDRKAHIGADVDSGLVHTVIGTAASVNGVTVGNDLPHGGEKHVFADAGYQGADKRSEAEGRTAQWHVAMQPALRRQWRDTPRIGWMIELAERHKALVRAKVENPFRVMKRQFGGRESALTRADSEVEHVAADDAVCPQHTVYGATSIADQGKILASGNGNEARENPLMSPEAGSRTRYDGETSAMRNVTPGRGDLLHPTNVVLTFRRWLTVRPRLNLRSRFLLLAFRLPPLFRLSVVASAALALFFTFPAGVVVAAPARVVAVLYDDSSSMKSEISRWIGANFSLQVLTSLLNDGDSLLLAKMNTQPQPRRYEVPAGVGRLLAEMQVEGQPSGRATPYDGVGQLLLALKDDNADERWLLVVTDGDFNSGYTPALVQQQIDTIAKPLGIRVVFLLIGSGKEFEAVRQWQVSGGALVFRAASGAEVPLRMEEIAGLLTGRDPNGIAVAREGIELAISSKFPLRGLVTLIQGDSGAQVAAADAGRTSMTLRGHSSRALSQSGGISSRANVSHLTAKDGIAAGDRIVRIRLSAPVGRDRVKVFPEVAARMDVTLHSMDGQPLERDKQGVYTYCSGEEVELRTRLVGADEKSITVGRTDVGAFEVGATLDGAAPMRAAIDASQEYFALRTNPSGEARVRPFARYPGYFNYSGESLHLRPVSCKREVLVALESTLGADGRWTERVDRLGTAPPVVFSILIDGRPATAEEVAAWRWQTEPGTNWDFIAAGNKLYFTARSGCCVLFWSRPIAHQSEVGIRSLATGYRRDTVRLPAPVRYEWTLPPDLLGKVWWLVGCPLAAALAALLLFLYLWLILVRKERFGRHAVVHVRDLTSREEKKEPLCRGRDLPKRWFLPSPRETKVIRGLQFVAIGRGGHMVKVSGRTLSRNDEVDDGVWQFNDDLEARKKPQPDARLRDYSIISRYRGAGRRNEDIAVRMQYVSRGQDPDWER